MIATTTTTEADTTTDVAPATEHDRLVAWALDAHDTGRLRVPDSQMDGDPTRARRSHWIALATVATRDLGFAVTVHRLRRAILEAASHRRSRDRGESIARGLPVMDGQDSFD